MKEHFTISLIIIPTKSASFCPFRANNCHLIAAGVKRLATARYSLASSMPSYLHPCHVRRCILLNSTTSFCRMTRRSALPFAAHRGDIAVEITVDITQAVCSILKSMNKITVRQNTRRIRGVDSDTLFFMRGFVRMPTAE